MIRKQRPKQESKLKLARKDLKKYFCSIRVVEQWNQLSNDTVNAKRIQKFKLYGCRESTWDGATYV